MAWLDSGFVNVDLSFLSFILIYTWFRRTRYTDTLMVTVLF